MKTTRAIPDSGTGNAEGVSRSRHAGKLRWALLTGALALVMPGTGFARELVFVAESTLRSAMRRAAWPTPRPLKEV